MKFAAALFTFCSAAALAAAEPVTLGAHIQPLLKEYCFDCHNAEKQIGRASCRERV